MHYLLHELNGCDKNIKMKNNKNNKINLMIIVASSIQVKSMNILKMNAETLNTLLH